MQLLAKVYVFPWPVTLAIVVVFIAAVWFFYRKTL